MRHGGSGKGGWGKIIRHLNGILHYFLTLFPKCFERCWSQYIIRENNLFHKRIFKNLFEEIRGNGFYVLR